MMRRAARLFLGEHDWTAFSAAQSDVKTRVRNVTRLEVAERFDAHGRGRLVEITAGAEGFLRYMVRSIAGALLAGLNRADNCFFISLAPAGGERPHAFTTAPARGLTLVEVVY
jgi:tRNA pseudouridine38-40 synthase